MFINVSKVKKSYGSGDGKTEILKGVSFEIDQGKICVILGPSGSGKSTILNMIGGLDTVDEGSIIIDDYDVVNLKSKKLSIYRRNCLGFVFQFYNLIPNLTVRENIRVCENLTKTPLALSELLDTLELSDHADKFPSQLSGGQQQRCAIARALIKNPKLLLCDEPTGALDYKSSKEMLRLIEKVNRTYGTTMLIVTHNIAIKDMANYVISIKDGQISEFVQNENPINADDIEW
jgi:putative ABC transport system ATP-binding protein